MAVRPVPSIPWVTSSAVELAENPDGPFLPKIHIFCRDNTKRNNPTNLKLALSLYFYFYTAKFQHSSGSLVILILLAKVFFFFFWVINAKFISYLPE
jgi:hypothetical protein